jgi:ATP-dependent Clp protease ATP-binding subunit ClpA
VTGANVLVAIFSERESHAAYFLQEQDMTRYDAVNFISHGVAKQPTACRARPAPLGADEGAEAEEEAPNRGTRRSAAYCVNLNAKAAEAGKIDPLIGREPRSSAASRCFAGGARTTRFSWVTRASARPPSPKAWPRRSSTVKPRGAGGGHHLFARHGRAAGRHPLSRRFRGTPEGGDEGAGAAPNAILFIDEIHTVIGAGATSGGAMDASNLLKPALQSGGKLRCMGSTTYKEYRSISRRTAPCPAGSRRSTWWSRPWRRDQDPDGSEAASRISTGPLHQ